MMSWDEAYALGRRYARANRQLIGRAAIVGSVLRGHVTCKDVDLLVTLRNGTTDWRTLPKVDGVNVFVTTDDNWEAALLHYAPGRAVIGMRALAKENGYRLNQYGLWLGGQCIAQSAVDICRVLGVSMPEPVRRSLKGESVLVWSHRWLGATAKVLVAESLS